MAGETGGDSSFLYGVITAIIGAAATQFGIWITAQKSRQASDRQVQGTVEVARLQRDGSNHESLVEMLSQRLSACEAERETWRRNLDEVEAKNIDLQRERARLRFYAGVLRGVLVTNKLPVPNLSDYDLNDEKELPP